MNTPQPLVRENFQAKVLERVDGRALTAAEEGRIAINEIVDFDNIEFAQKNVNAVLDIMRMAGFSIELNNDVIQSNLGFSVNGEFIHLNKLKVYTGTGEDGSTQLLVLGEAAHPWIVNLSKLMQSGRIPQLMYKVIN